MGGSWIQLNNSDTYYSTARDMARFGLLILNEGVWDEDVIPNDTNYFSNMVNTSQEINKSYGYLGWLNVKESLISDNNSNRGFFSFQCPRRFERGWVKTANILMLFQVRIL